MRSVYQNDETAEQEDWFVTEQEHRRMERRRREAANPEEKNRSFHYGAFHTASAAWNGFHRDEAAADQ